MSDSCAVLIAPEEVVASLLERRAFPGEVLAFGRDNAVDAFGAIASRYPDVIALDHTFAMTPRGLALVERVQSDPLLAAAEILIVGPDGSLSRFQPGSVTILEVPAASPAPAPENAGEPAAAPARPDEPALDQRGTRRAPRIPIKPNMEVLIDGKEAVLVDLSVLGAQVLSQTVVRPNKPVRIVMPDENVLVKVNGVIVWARFEMLHGHRTPHYRAGIAFKDPDPVAVMRYCERRGRGGGSGSE